MMAKVDLDKIVVKPTYKSPFIKKSTIKEKPSFIPNGSGEGTPQQSIVSPGLGKV